MKSSRKILITLAGVVLISASVSSIWMTIRVATREIPAVGFDDLFNRLHPEWRGRPSTPWPPCFGLCKGPFL